MVSLVVKKILLEEKARAESILRTAQARETMLVNELKEVGTAANFARVRLDEINRELKGVGTPDTGVGDTL